MPVFTREELLRATKLQQQEVATPRGTWIIQELTKAKQQEIQDEATLKHNTATRKKGDIDQSYLEMLMLVESSVEPKLERADVLALKQLPLSITQPVLAAIVKLNRLAEGDVQAAESTFPERQLEAV